MSIIRRRNREAPGLNTASLPDLIFTILFFFMIVTHMRKVNLKVEYKTPEGKELTQLARKNNTTYIFIGRPTDPALLEKGQRTCIQVNDEVVSLGELRAYLRRLGQQTKANGGGSGHTVCLKADRNTPMKTIESVKQALREAKMLNVSYDAMEKKTKR